jgi:hypothetical protein
MRNGISITLNEIHRRRLDAVVADRNTPQKHVWRARIVLMSADGFGTSAIIKVLAEHPQWWRFLLQPAIIYGDTSQNAAADLLIRDSERRCAAVLLRLSGLRFARPDDAKPVQVPLTQSELAGAANLSRNSVGTMVKRLVARGLIEQGRQGIVVCAPMALRAFVEKE